MPLMSTVRQFATEVETPVVLAAIAHGFNVREIEALKRVIKRAKTTDK